MFRQFPRAATCAAFAVAASLGLSACAKGPFHGAASMRVEVEVYKGPLSKEPEIQWAALKALIREVPNALTALNDGVIVTAAKNGFLPNYQDIIWPLDKPTRLKIQSPSSGSNSSGTSGQGSTRRVVSEVENLKTSRTPTEDLSTINLALEDLALENLKTENQEEISKKIVEIQNMLNLEFRPKVIEFCSTYSMKRKLTGFIWELDTYAGCLMSAQLHDDIVQLLTRIRKVEESIGHAALAGVPDKPMVKNILPDSAEVATIFKSKAIYWSEAHTAAPPQNRLVRISMTNFSNFASEMANQIESRADALLKQIAGEGRPRQELATSVYLRDTMPTDFLNLYIWNRAAAPALIEEMILHPLNAFSSEETTDRVRVIERLFADMNWSKVNTVYASGQGEVAMALIKDDIGNWNLKSFDSDPTELVEAYTDVTKAAIKAVATAVASGGSSGALDSVLATASRLTRGQMGDGGATAGGFNVAALHDRALKEIEELRTNTAMDYQDKLGEVTGAKAGVNTNTGTAMGAESAAKGAENKAGLGEGGVKILVPQPDPEKPNANATDTANRADEIAIRAGLKAEAHAASPSSRQAIEDGRKAEVYADEARKKAQTPEVEGTTTNGDDANRFAHAALMRAKAAAAKAELAAAKAALKAQYVAMLAEARDILDDHAAIIDVLQEGATAGAAQ